MSPRRVILIGAARSGTKMLRGALAAATGAGAVPYDVGYVWRYRNEGAPDDVLDAAHIDERSRRFIQRFVDGYANGETSTVIEKTVGNTLRVPFVASVFPDARYIHLVRDGVDVAESARRQWAGGFQWRYIAAKARHVPLRVAPRFGAGYVGSLAAHALRRNPRVGSWGPRYPGIDIDLTTEDRLVVCGRQWRESVEAASQAFHDLRLTVCEVRYEDLVGSSTETLGKLSEFMEMGASADNLEAAAKTIRCDRIGTGRGALSQMEKQVLNNEIGDTLTHWGYDRPTGVGFPLDQPEERCSP